MTDMIRLGLVQMCMHADAETNMNAAIEGIREAAAQGAEVICLPELFRSPYSAKPKALSPSSWPSPSLAPLPNA